MSRNNDYIKIDELFKGLGHGEEKEPTGAWSRMENLLDHQMPIGTYTTTRKYRFLVPLLAALLLVGGGLFLWNKHNSSDDSINTPTQGNKLVANSHQNENKPTNNGKNLLGITEINKQKTEANEQKAPQKQLLASTSKHTPIQKDNNNPKYSEIPDLKQKITKKNNNIKNNSSVAQSKVNQSDMPAKEQSLLMPNIPDSLWVTQPIIEQKVLEVIKGDPAKAKENNVESNNWTSGINYKNKEVVGNQNGQYFEKEKKNVQRFDLIKKQVKDNTATSSRIKTVIDTISIVRIQKIKYTPLSKIETYKINQLVYGTTATPTETLTATELADASANSSFLVPLATFKVKSKRINTLDVIKNTAGGLTNYFDGTHKFYAGLLVGGNVSMGNPNAYGMQVGAIVNYTLAERWTLSAEFKFINKYFPQFSYLDEEKDYQLNKEQTNNGWLFTGTGSTVSNNYVIKSTNNFNLPIYLGYYLTDRLSVFGGVNFDYGMPIKFTKENSFKTVDINELSSGSENPYHNSAFKVNEHQDFKTRFGIGYLAGMNYELSRRFSLDGRVTQSLWNNGSKNIAPLYHLSTNPSFELSLGIYFGRREKVTYIMDRR